jgi:hypothetical protein
MILRISEAAMIDSATLMQRACCCGIPFEPWTL